MVKKLIKEVIGEVSLKTLLVSLLFIGSVFVFGFLAHVVVNQDENSFDKEAFNFFKMYSTETLVAVMTGLTFFGSTWFIMAAYVILIIIMIIYHRRSDAINIAILAVSSTLLMFGLKEFFKRQRPDLPLLKELRNFSFPSGHAVCSFIFCSVLIYLVWKGKMQISWKWALSILLFFFAVSVGISRIVLRYHYATDVLAGFCLGAAWVILSLWIEKKLTPRRVERQLDA
jgi:undecaprenyl-diphosphatase